MIKHQASVIELHLTRKEKDSSPAWSMKTSAFERIEQWVQRHRRWTSPFMFITLVLAFGAAFSPWVHHYQVAKETSAVSTSLSSFRTLYTSYGDGNASASADEVLQPLTPLLDSIEAKMHVVGVPAVQIARVMSAWDSSYQLTGATKEILIRPVSLDACKKLAVTPTLQSTLRDAVLHQIKFGKHREPGCYLQAWKGEPNTSYLPYSFMKSEQMVTPVAYIILREPEQKPVKKPVNQTLYRI